ncbi:MAG: SpoIIE family protein phosphatase [Thermodesulfobacteriota bacterium]
MRKKIAKLTRPIGSVKCTSRLIFIAGFWPVLLVFGVGPLGTILSTGREFQGSSYGLLMSLTIFVALYAAAALWSYHPLDLIVSGISDTTAPLSDAHPIERAVKRLPIRVGKSFLLAGFVFSTLVIIVDHLSFPDDIPPLPAMLIAAMTFTLYFAFCIVTTALALGSTLLFTMKLRKGLSHYGAFSGESPEPRLKLFSSIDKRPALIFIITSIIPILLMGIFFLVGRRLEHPVHQRIVYANITVLFFGVVICGTYLVHTIRQSLKMVFDELEEGMDSIKHGDFDKRIPVLIDDETGTIARSLNTALEGLKEREDMKDSLRIAADIQKGMIPQEMPDIPGFSVSAFQESSYEVGGDYYDIIDLEDGRLWLVVADVTGKGYPAALTVANLYAMLHTLASTKESFDRLPAFLNHALTKTMTQGRFVTAFMAEITKGSNQLKWFNAGHMPTILATDDEMRLLESNGPPFGVMPESSIMVQTETLSDGDLIAAYSDGISELRMSSDETQMFGVDGTRDWVYANREIYTHALPEKFLVELAEYGEIARDDDLTVLFLKYEG